MQMKPLPRLGGRGHGMKPTPRQKAIWDWMIAYQRAHCMPPTVRQLGDAFGHKSPNGMTVHLRALVRKKMVMHIGGTGSWHSYLAVFPDDRCPCCGRKPLGQTEYARRINEPDPGREMKVPPRWDSIPMDRPSETTGEASKDPEAGGLPQRAGEPA